MKYRPYFAHQATELLFFLFAVLLVVPGSRAATVRQPVWSGIFYPANQAELSDTIDRLASEAREDAVLLPNKQLKGLILPHAGYVYSGLTAAHGALALEGQNIDKVILMGPDHRVGFPNAALTNLKAYQTPLGQVPIHDDAARLRLLQPKLFQAVPQSDSSEHSLEVILPFLQFMLSEFQIIPLVLGPADISQISSAIEPLVTDRTLLVVSSDLSHYLDYPTATARDRETIRMILDLDAAGLSRSGSRACGIIPIKVIIQLAGKHGWQPVLLHYSNSGDTAGDRKRVVGYSAIAFYGDPLMDTTNLLTKEQGQALVRLARQTIESRFKPGTAAPLPAVLRDQALLDNRGIFVTLKINNQLRGCIGNISGDGSIVEGVKRNSVNAAFNDHRFRPLSAEELDDIHIEVSILTSPQPLEYKDANDLLDKLRPNVDGVILRQGPASATFLPQVWKQLPAPADFLSHLCKKAGLSGEAWRNSQLEIQTYQVQYFEEAR